LVNKKHFNGFSKLDIRQQNSEGQFPEASQPNSIFTKKYIPVFRIPLQFKIKFANY